MTYEPFAVLLKPYWDLPLSGVPAALSTRTIAEGVYALWGGWDALGPEGRQSVAEGHDAMLDPARKGERESFCKLIQEIDQCSAIIALLAKMHPQTITEIGVQETKLATLTAELATLQQRLVAPSREAAAVQPATVLRPVTPAPAEDVGALSEPDKAAPAEVVGALAGADKGKKVETLAFEKAALGYMTDVWNDWKINRARDSSLKEPTKGVMHGAVLNKLNEAVIKGSRRTPTITMVSQATRPWQKPSVMNVQISPALAPKKRHVFKGDK
jgi:hypothetical protein